MRAFEQRRLKDADGHRVLAAIERAAAAGLPCPSNDAICGIIGVRSTGTASQLLGKLAAQGLISIERFNRARVVTITATGKATARPAGGAATLPHWRDRKGPAWTI